jgi:ABC-type polysaccharide/polyol phosphate export permease
MFFVAPGLVALDSIPDPAAQWLKLNPLTSLFEGYRDALLYGRSPEAWELVIPVVFSIVVLAASVPVYRREQVHFAKVVE